MIIRIVIFMLLASISYAEDYWVAILCYHQIFPEPQLQFDVSIENFEKQIQFLKDNFLIVSLKDLIDHIDSKTAYPSNAVVITFDDGDKSIYKYAFPILKINNIPATVFIYTNVMKEGRGLTWEDMKEMSGYGIDFGSHSVSHVNLTKKEHNETQQKYEERIIKELTESKKIIEENLKKPAKYLAYPFGRYNDFVEKQAIEAGYEAMLNVHWDKNTINSNKYKLRRRIIPKDYNMEKFVNIFKGNLPDVKNGN